VIASRTTILHVEDDSNDVLLFHHACQKAGILLELQTVPDGQDAIAYLRGDEQYQDRERYPLPNLVLLDLKMPRVSGVEVLAWIRQAEPFRRLPVVVLSSSNHEADVRRAYDAGANSYLMKPVDFNALVELAQTVHRYWLKLNERPE
jgi:CheY-like chemotaxis protein